MNLRRFVLVLILTCLPMAARAVTVERVTSPGGIEAWLVEDHSNPIIAFNFAFRGGAALDPQGKTGLAYMVGGLLDEGAGDLDSQAFHSKLDDLAISFGFEAGMDAFHGHVKTLTANRDVAFDLLRLSLTQPRFDQEAVDRIRAQILAELAQQLQDPDSIAQRRFAKLMYPDHPYGRPVDGQPDTVKAIAVEDLKAWPAAHLGRDQLYVSVVGDMTPDQLRPLLDQVFGTLPAHAAPITVAEVAPAAKGQVEVVHREIPQSVVLFGEQGLKRADPDWYTAYVMNYILGGGGFSSRLLQEIRVKRGLAYGAYSYLFPRDHSAMIEGGVATRNDRVAESLQLVRAEWKRMAEKGVTAQELADAKTFLNGSFPLQMGSTGAIASLLVTIQLDRLGIDYLDKRASLINAVTQADIQRVAQRLLDAQRLAAVVVGNPVGLQTAGQ
jgi:zinc protease